MSDELEGKYRVVNCLRMVYFIPLVLLLMGLDFAPGLTGEERKLAMAYLYTTKEDLLKSIKGLSKEQMNFKLDEETWSVAECVEHIALMESNLFDLLQNSLKEPADPSKRSDIKLSDADVYKGITDRTYKIKTQEPLMPAAKLGSNESTLKAFLAKRDVTTHYVKTTTDDLRNHFFTFPLESIGTVDSFQLIIFMAGHSKRHTLQIEELKKDASFPK
ncbi:MAG TPA: DinB family protein [Chryseolinea sp.]|nr:DinB family protein [Chryseolinea sp.]